MNKKTIFIFLVTIILLNCGNKTPLTLPIEKNPQTIAKIAVKQVDDEICINWTFPPKLSDKATEMDTAKIRRIQVYCSDEMVNEKKFKKRSNLLKKLKLQELTSKNDEYEIKIKFKIKNLDRKKYYFGLVYFYGRDRSPLSTIAQITTAIPVKPITSLKLTKENKIIKLEWQKPLLDVENNPVTDLKGYTIYRKIEIPALEKQEGPLSGPPAFQKLNPATIGFEYFEDTDTSIDGSYHYYVAANLSDNVESAPSNIITVAVKDEYPPDIPANLVSFKTPQYMYLTWSAVPDKDLSHYKVYRRTADTEDFSLVADKVKENSFKDTRCKKETLYFYTVTAVDRNGNESRFSNIVKEQF